MKRIQLSFFLSLITCLSIAQVSDSDPNLDSLFNIANRLKNKNPNKAINLLDSIADLARSDDDFRALSNTYLIKWSVYSKLEDFIQINLYQDSLKGMYKHREKDDLYFYYLLTSAINQHVNTKYDSALVIYNEISENCNPEWKNYLNLKTRVLSNMASIHRKRGEYDIAVKCLNEGIKIAEDTLIIANDVARISSLLGLYNGMGLIYRRTQEYNKAIEMYDKGLALIESDDSRRFNFLLNKVNGFFHLKRFDDALSESDRLYPYFDELKKKQKYNFIFDRTQILIHSGKLIRAKPLIDSMWMVQKKYNLKPQQALSLEADYYFEKGDFKTAKKSYQNYLSSVSKDEVNSRLGGMRGYIKSNLAIYDQEAYQSFTLFDSLSKANYQNNLKSGVNEWEVKYETQKKQNEIASLRQENKIKSLSISKNRLWLLFLAFMLASLAILLLIYRKLLRQEKETNRFLDSQRESLTDQNKILLEQIGSWDSIKNSFFIIPGKENRKIRLEDLVYMASDGNEVIFYTTQNKYRAWLRLKDLVQDLPSEHFARSHRSYIINIHHTSFENNQYLLMSNGDKIPLSKTYKENVEKSLKNFY